MVVACTKQQFVVVDQMGRQIPHPHYKIQTSNLYLVFYYTKKNVSKDIDGVELNSYIFLDRNQIHKFQKDDDILLIIEVFNPNENIYRIDEKTIFSNGKMEYGKTIGKSNQQYRKFEIELPTDYIGNVFHEIKFFDDRKNILFTIDGFGYIIR